MGVTAHHAGTGREASRLIESHPIHIAVVDLALPLDLAASQFEREPEFAEGGPRLLELLSRLDQPPPVVAIKRSRSSRDDTRDLSAALRLGVFAVIDRPRELSDLNVILNVLRRCLERHYQGRWPTM
jgi:DNA-binding NarL/FixJ family response regulator